MYCGVQAAGITELLLKQCKQETGSDQGHGLGQARSLAVWASSEVSTSHRRGRARQLGSALGDIITCAPTLDTQDSGSIIRCKENSLHKQNQI